jgi:hypothetical protein
MSAFLSEDQSDDVKGTIILTVSRTLGSHLLDALLAITLGLVPVATSDRLAVTLDDVAFPATTLHLPPLHGAGCSRLF